MTRAWPLVAVAVLCATPSRADDPIVCMGGRCVVLTFDEHAERQAPSDTSDGPGLALTPFVWIPVGAGTVVDLTAARQEVEPDGDGAIGPRAPTAPQAQAARDALARLGMLPSTPDHDELKAAKVPVQPDAHDDALPTVVSSDGPAQAPPPPDDLGFLDVVLVGQAGEYHCTGVLVAPDAVLTAGHCLPATEVAVAFRTNAPFARIRATDAVRHPLLDAALLRLAQPLPLVVRPRRHAADRTPPIGTVRMVGFGVDDPRHPSSFGVKRRVDADVTGWGCDRSRARTAGCRPNAEMLLTAVGGGDTCFGDSGGPVLEDHADGYRLIAITSRPTASGASLCGHGGIYVRVDVLDAWLNSSLEQPR